MTRLAGAPEAALTIIGGAINLFDCAGKAVRPVAEGAILDLAGANNVRFDVKLAEEKFDPALT